MGRNTIVLLSNGKLRTEIATGQKVGIETIFFEVFSSCLVRNIINMVLNSDFVKIQSTEACQELSLTSKS